MMGKNTRDNLHVTCDCPKTHSGPYEDLKMCGGELYVSHNLSKTQGGVAIPLPPAPSGFTAMQLNRRIDNLGLD